METDYVDVEAHEVGTAVAVAPAMALIAASTPDEFLERSVAVATALANVVRKQNLVTMISGREHVRVEAWTMLGAMLGVFPVVEWTRETPDGWEARVEARTLAGDVVGAAESMCSKGEKTWSKRDPYALRSMAQTRATSKALRGPLGFVMQLAGFDPTPAEEMPNVVEHEQKGPNQVPIPQTWAQVEELVRYHGEPIWLEFQALMRAAKDHEPRFSNSGQFRAAAAGVAVALREEFEPTELPGPGLADLQRLWSAAVAGAILTPVYPEPEQPAAEPPATPETAAQDATVGSPTEVETDDVVPTD